MNATGVTRMLLSVPRSGLSAEAMAWVRDVSSTIDGQVVALVPAGVSDAHSVLPRGQEGGVDFADAVRYDSAVSELFATFEPSDLLVVESSSDARELNRLVRDLPCPLVVLPSAIVASASSPLLVGLDGTDHNYLVADWAAALAASVNRPLHGTYATNPMYDTFDNAGNYGDADLRARFEADSEVVQLHERTGRPASVIGDVARDLEAFLVVIGVHDQHTFAGVPLHDVARRLLESVPAPLAILPERFVDIWWRDRVVTGTPPELAPGQLDRLRGSTTVLTLTDDHPDPTLGEERRFAARLAAELGARLVLVDRSTATWFESPHVEGPFDSNEMRAHGHDAIADQMDEATGLGAPEVVVVAPSVPTFEAIADAVSTAGADVIVVPAHLRHPRLAERWHHHADVGVSVKDLVGDRHIVVLGDRPRLI